MYIAFASSVPVDAFLSTYDDFVSLVTDKCATDLPLYSPLTIVDGVAIRPVLGHILCNCKGLLHCPHDPHPAHARP